MKGLQDGGASLIAFNAVEVQRRVDERRLPKLSRVHLCFYNPLNRTLLFFHVFVQMVVSAAAGTRAAVVFGAAAPAAEVTAALHGQSAQTIRFTKGK